MRRYPHAVGAVDTNNRSKRYSRSLTGFFLTLCTAWTAIYLSVSGRNFPGRDSSGAYIVIGARHAGVRIWVRGVGLYLWNGSAWERAFNGRLAKTLTDANATLTAVEAANDILEFTGTLTATRNIVVPLAAKQWTVFNGTGQSLQFIGATGAGITVAAGKRAILYADGTNVVRVTADV